MPLALCGTNHTNAGFQDSPLKMGEDSASRRTMESPAYHEQSPKIRRSSLVPHDKGSATPG